jgi:UDP-galactopyranose mutase
MFKVSLTENKSIQDIFNTDTYLDESVTTYQITQAEFTQIQDSKRFDFWQYKDGKVVESEFKAEIIKTEFNRSQKQSRQSAYEKESDPLFMKYQRGEATKEEWEAKVEAIKLMYPYQV